MWLSAQDQASQYSCTEGGETDELLALTEEFGNHAPVDGTIPRSMWVTQIRVCGLPNPQVGRGKDEKRTWEESGEKAWLEYDGTKLFPFLTARGL